MGNAQADLRGGSNVAIKNRLDEITDEQYVKARELLIEQGVASADQLAETKSDAALKIDSLAEEIADQIAQMMEGGEFDD